MTGNRGYGVQPYCKVARMDVGNAGRWGRWGVVGELDCSEQGRGGRELGSLLVGGFFLLLSSLRDRLRPYQTRYLRERGFG